MEIPALLATLLVQPWIALADAAAAPRLDPGADVAAATQVPAAASDPGIAPSPLMLAEVYRLGIAVADY